MVKGNEITYPGLFLNTDVRYRLQGSGVKEDLILQRYANQNTFTFEVKLSGLNAVTEQDGTISFADNKGTKLWFLEKPYMTDASGNYSDNVQLVLREANGKTFVDVVADQAFLQNPATHYRAQLTRRSTNGMSCGTRSYPVHSRIPLFTAILPCIRVMTVILEPPVLFCSSICPACQVKVKS